MRILDVLTSPWAIEPAKYREIVEIYQTHLKGEKIDLAALEARLGGPLPGPTAGYEVQAGVAIVPLEGVIAKRMNMIMRTSGGTSLELFQRDFRAAMADPAAHSVVLYIDSPGGNVQGVQLMAEEIFAARGGKPVVAYTDGLMASAAYWLGSAAGAVLIADDTTMVGSIGVVTQHVDVSKADEKAGVKVTQVYAGKYKTLGSSSEPLSDEALADLQAKVDAVYGIFVDAVARHRGADAQTVLSDMAEGRVFLGREAISAGLVDGVSTLDALIADLNAGRVPAQRSKSSQMTAEAGAAEAGATPPQPIPPQPIEGSEMTINRDFLLANHAALCEEFRAEGFKLGRAEGATAGAEVERERIRSVEAQGMPGHQVLIQALKFDGKTTGAEAAIQVLAAHKAKLGKTAGDLAADAAALDKVAPSGSADGGAIADPKPADAAPDHSPEAIATRCTEAWEKDPKVRAEFVTLEAYTAFSKAEAAGRVRILGKKAA